MGIITLATAIAMSPLGAVGASATSNTPVAPTGSNRSTSATTRPPTTTGLVCDVLHDMAGSAFDLANSSTSVNGKTPDEWLEIASYLYVTWPRNLPGHESPV